MEQQYSHDCSNMPYISENIIIAGTQYDKRKKITEAEKELVKRLHGKISIRSIARLLPHISRRSIQFILFPERAEKVAARQIETRRWEKHNKKEYHTPLVKKYRRRKQQLYLAGKIHIDKK